MSGFVLTGKIADVLTVLSVLAEFEWEFLDLLSQLNGKTIRCS